MSPEAQPHPRTEGRRVLMVLGGLLFLLASSALVAAASPLGAPVALIATPQGDDTVKLSWEPPVDDGGSEITEYRIYRAPVDGSLALVNSTSTTSYVDKLPDEPGTVMEYRVTAVSAGAESGKSNPAYAPTTGGCIIVDETETIPVVINLEDCLPAGSSDGFELLG